MPFGPRIWDRSWPPKAGKIRRRPFSLHLEVKGDLKDFTKCGFFILAASLEGLPARGIIVALSKFPFRAKQFAGRTSDDVELLGSGFWHFIYWHFSSLPFVDGQPPRPGTILL